MAEARSPSSRSQYREILHKEVRYIESHLYPIWACQTLQLPQPSPQ